MCRIADALTLAVLAGGKAAHNAEAPEREAFVKAAGRGTGGCGFQTPCAQGLAAIGVLRLHAP